MGVLRWWQCYFIAILGNPIFFSTSLAFANFSGNKFFPLYFSKDLSITTIGVFRLFSSSIVIIVRVH